MRIKTGAIPVPNKDAQLKPWDFSAVLQVVPTDCVLIGGQAVAWWAGRYGIKAVVEGHDQEVTSKDIDFWGTHQDLLQLAAQLNRKPVLPNRYELTLLVGSIQLEAGGQKTAVEVLHDVPGLDSADPLTAAVPAELPTAKGGRQFLVLSPVSLVLAKLHALRHFSQEERQDLTHLQVSLHASKMFIAEALIQSSRLALWNCNRLIDAQRRKPNQKLEKEHGFQILSAVPIDAIRSVARQGKAGDRQKLQRFLSLQWPKTIATGQTNEL